MKKMLSLVLVAVMIMTLSSSAIYAAPNNNPNASFNRNQAASENKAKNKTFNEGDEDALREQLRFTMLHGEGLPYGIGKRLVLPPGLQMLFERGTLPHGIAKKLMDNYYPLPGKKTDLEMLEALINNAEAKLVDVDADDYKGGDVTIDTFEVAILAAQTFIDGYVETQKSMIKPEIDKLKAAIKAFDDAKFVPEKLNEVLLIRTNLLTYKTNYYALLTDEKQDDLDELIAFITTFISTEKLTKGDFDKIVLKAKAFQDPLTLLYVNLDVAKELYKEPVEDYLEGSHVNLAVAINDAEVFLAAHTTSELINIVVEVEEQVEDLEEAIEVFKDGELLGDAELAVLMNLMASLQNIYDEDPEFNLFKLINRIDEYVKEEKILTIGVYSEFLEASKVYISDLYVYLVAELEALIVDAKEEVLVAPASNEKTALVALVEEIEAYVNADNLKYEELVAYFNELVVAINAL